METKPLYSIRMVDLETDYPVVSQWWPAHGWPAVAKPILPKLGVIVSLGGEPVAATWLYMDNSTGVAIMEWTVTNPKNTPRESFKACGLLLTAIRDLARDNDYGVVLTSAKQQSLVRAYERNGFTISDTGMTHLVMLTKI